MKGRSNLVFSVLGLLTIVTACHRSLDEQSYIDWVQDYDNGLHVQKESGDYRFDVQYLPSDFRWLQFKEGQKGNDDSVQYYMLTIGPKDKSLDLVNFNVQNELEKQRKLYYLSYTFQDDLSIVENGETFPCVLYHFERPADMRTSRTFLLGFQTSYKMSTKATLVISSSLFGSLPVNIKISKENIPGLRL